MYAYGFTLEKGKKCLPQEVAIEMWRLIFSAHPWPLLESWYETHTLPFIWRPTSLVQGNAGETTAFF